MVHLLDNTEAVVEVHHLVVTDVLLTAANDVLHLVQIVLALKEALLLVTHVTLKAETDLLTVLALKEAMMALLKDQPRLLLVLVQHLQNQVKVDTATESLHHLGQENHLIEIHAVEIDLLDHVTTMVILSQHLVTLIKHHLMTDQHVDLTLLHQPAVTVLLDQQDQKVVLSDHQATVFQTENHALKVVHLTEATVPLSNVVAAQKDLHLLTNLMQSKSQ